MKVYEFDDHKNFKEAALTLHNQNLLVEIYSFIPEDELVEKLNLRSTTVSWAAVIGAIIGAGLGFLLQYIPNVYSYPMNISGKPLNSWPAFLLITFELGVLTCAFCVVASFILKNKLPRMDRDIFSVDSYHLNRHQHYFIVSKKEDPHVKAMAVHDIADSH